jgi:hypothetical protein
MAIPSRRTSIARALLVAGILSSALALLSAQQLPPTHAKTLSGRSVTLPVPDHPQTFLAVGFSKASSDAVKAWWIQARALCQAHPAVACYEAAVLEDAPSFIHGMIVSSMKRGMEPDRQDTFLTVFENEAAWKQAFGFSAPDDAYLAIFDKTGKVVWRTSGAESAVKPAAIAKGFNTASQ